MKISGYHGIGSWLILPIRLYLGLVFLFACYHKIMHPGDFALDIATYDILPLYLVNLMALTLPWVELFVGVMLVLGIETRAAGLIASGMMVMFMAALIAAIMKGIEAGCGCFASQSVAEEDPISYMTVLRDSVWLAMAVCITLFDRNPPGVGMLFTSRGADTATKQNEDQEDR